MKLIIRPAEKHDLDAINQIIEAAILTWELPERVIRLTLPTYIYSEMDLQHMSIVVACQKETIVGVAAWEPADPIDAPKNTRALMLHGIYVNPALHRQGIGAVLFQAAEQSTKKQRLNGIVVKAQKGSEAFYQSQGMHNLKVEDKKREFENRFWKANKKEGIKHPLN